MEPLSYSASGFALPGGADGLSQRLVSLGNDPLYGQPK